MPIGGSASWRSVSWPKMLDDAVLVVGEVAADRDDREREERGDQRQVRRQLEHQPVGAVGDQVLLEEELDAVGQGLQHAERPGPVRADAVLHVADDLALEPDHQHRGDQQEREHDDGLDHDDEDDGQVDVAGEQRVGGEDRSRHLQAEVGDRARWRR